MKLYFDFINQNRTVAITEKSKNVTYNLNQINLRLSERFTDVIATNNAGTTIFPLNEFICIVSLSLDQKIYEMVVVDLRNNIEAAVDYSANIDNDEARKIFMECFHEIRKGNFEKIKELEFVEGDAPPPDPLKGE
jgi:Sec7-like guanine-nucleotide exchange factor